MKKRIIYTMMALAGSAVAFIVLDSRGHIQAAYDGDDARSTINTQFTLQTLCTCIDMMILEGYEHPINMEMITEYAQQVDDVILTASLYNNKIYDGWESPIFLLFEEPAKYTFISCGPNKQYDQGTVDDIVQIYDYSSDGTSQIETVPDTQI